MEGDDAGMRFLTVYTVSMSGMLDTVMHETAGSYIRCGDAVRECADYVIRQLELNPMMRREAIRDPNYDVRSELLKAGVSEGLIDGFFGNTLVTGLDMDDGMRSALREYLVDEIGETHCYMIGSRRFDVDENDVECSAGLRIWVCVTSGRSEFADPEWDNAFPQVFLNRNDAMKCAMDDLESCIEGYDKREHDEIVLDAKSSLNDDGHYEFVLNDETSRIWDIWTTSVNIGQGLEQEKEDDRMKATIIVKGAGKGAEKRRFAATVHEEFSGTYLLEAADEKEARRIVEEGIPDYFCPSREGIGYSRKICIDPD